MVGLERWMISVTLKQFLDVLQLSGKLLAYFNCFGFHDTVASGQGGESLQQLCSGFDCGHRVKCIGYHIDKDELEILRWELEGLVLSFLSIADTFLTSYLHAILELRMIVMPLCSLDI